MVFPRSLRLVTEPFYEQYFTHGWIATGVDAEYAFDAAARVMQNAGQRKAVGCYARAVRHRKIVAVDADVEVVHLFSMVVSREWAEISGSGRRFNPTMQGG